MAINIHTNYYQDNLQNMTCLDCGKNFIVGENISKDIEISCPYCKTYSVCINAYSDEEKLEDMQMGCLGIYYYDEDEKMEEDNKIYCSNCKKVMDEGYTICDGLQHYCSDECLEKEITKGEYKWLYEEGYAFWTTFED